MKRIFFLLLIIHCSFSIVHSENISDVFTTMPDSIFPLLTAKNRHDMVDFYRNRMEAKVRNRLNNYVTLDTLTDCYLRLSLSHVSRAEMRLMQTTDSATIVCLVQTVTTPVCDSRVTFFDCDWHRLHWLELPVADTAEFFSAAPDSAAAIMQFAQHSVDDLRLVEVSLSPDVPDVELRLCTDELDEEEKQIARRHLHALRYRWTGTDFVLVAD